MNAIPSRSRWGGARSRLLAVLIGASVVLAACGPEDGRERGDGDGSGADPDNRDDSVQLHGDEPPLDRIFFDTPEEDRPIAETE